MKCDIVESIVDAARANMKAIAIVYDLFCSEAAKVTELELFFRLKLANIDGLGELLPLLGFGLGAVV